MPLAGMCLPSLSPSLPPSLPSLSSERAMTYSILPPLPISLPPSLLQDVFSEISTEPIAAASLAQVYKAKLRGKKPLPPSLPPSLLT